MFKLTVISMAVLASTSALAQPAQIYITPQGQRLTLEQFQINTVMTQVGAPAAWSRGFTGRGVTIAVLDQGFGLNTYDLQGAVKEYKNFYTGPINAHNAGWGYHGTAMASIAAGRTGGGVGTVGVAPGATLILGQVGQGGRMPNIDTSAVIRGLNWAEQQGATAVNMSFGSAFDSNYVSGSRQIALGVWQGNTKYGVMYGQATTLAQYKSSTNTTSVILAAAGNQGLPYAAFPGAFATATDTQGNLTFGGRWLIVGSVNDKNQISSFSNRAGHICTNIAGTVCQDTYQVKDFYVVAPGERVVASADNSASAEHLATFSTGTSAATAMVSGGVALIKQAWPQLKAAEIVALVKNTATDLGKAGVDEVYGHGLVNFDKATQPYAGVTYSKVVLKSGNNTAGVSLNATGVTATGVVSNSLGNSEVLKNLQVVDGINRNFTVDMTRAIGNNNNSANSFYKSPYLAMQPLGYQESSARLSADTVFTVMQNLQGTAMQFETTQGSGKVNLQVGAMAERNGFLNNSGSGLLAMGNSSTTYAMVGATMPLATNLDLVTSYGVGVTNTGNIADSLLKLSSTVISDTWRLGVAKKEIFYSGKTTDQLTFAVQGPVSVRKGHADVTGVTGYTYSGTEDDVSATPVISTERLNLAGGVRQTDLVLGYSVNVANKTQMGFNIARQFNVSGNQGVTGTAVGMMMRSSF
jgi:hypothetical protein